MELVVKRKYNRSEFDNLGREYRLEKEMTTHSGVLAWRIPWTEEPCGLQSLGLQRVRQDLATEHAGSAQSSPIKAS